MRILVLFGVAALLLSASNAVAAGRTFWFLLDEKTGAWCGYADERAFQVVAERTKPLESARATDGPGQSVVITYQVQPDSGDWLVVDKYDFSGRKHLLRRAYIFAQNGVQVIKEARIARGRHGPFRVVDVKAPAGIDVTKIDFPEVRVRTQPAAFPFMRLLTSLRANPTSKICEQKEP